MHNEIRLKIGQIEFEVKGDSETIERERIEFFKMLPQVITALSSKVYAHEIEMAQIEVKDSEPIKSALLVVGKNISINEFLTSKKFDNEVDIVLCIAFYAKRYSEMDDFTSNDIKELIKRAKIKVPSNISQNIRNNTLKGYMQDNGKNDATLTKYSLTLTGIEYVENYIPKEVKDNGKSIKQRKVRSEVLSAYKDFKKENFNLENYPTVKDLEKFKDKMILALYIVVNENKGEYFTVNDVSHILSELFGEKSTSDQVKGVFTRESDWFNRIADMNNKKTVKYKLMNGAIDFANEIIASCKK